MILKILTVIVVIVEKLLFGGFFIFLFGCPVVILIFRPESMTWGNYGYTILGWIVGYVVYTIVFRPVLRLAYRGGID